MTAPPSRRSARLVVTGLALFGASCTSAGEEGADQVSDDAVGAATSGAGPDDATSTVAGADRGTRAEPEPTSPGTTSTTSAPVSRPSTTSTTPAPASRPSTTIDQAELDAVFDGYAEAVSAALVEFERDTFLLPGVAVGSSLEDAHTFFGGMGDALSGSAERIDTATVPAAASAAHAEFVTRIGEFADLNTRISEAVATFESPDELEGMVVDPDLGVENFNATRRAMLRACDDLQTVAASNADVDLSCRSLEPLL